VNRSQRTSLLLAASFACLATSTQGVSNEARKPNFVIILADDMGYGDISAYKGWIETPHLDRLAAEGLRFTDFHSNGAVCSPTRAALLTGRYQQRAGIPMAVTVKLRHLGLQPREVTFAEEMKQAGYATAIFGKWHLGFRAKYNPIRHGFDRFRGFVSGNVDYLSHIDQSGAHDWWHQDRQVEEPGYTTHLLARDALEFIDEHKDEPFFLYLPHEAPHYPYQGPGDEADRSVGGEFPMFGSRADKKEAYREMVVELDKGVGEVIAKLKEHGLESNTLVFFFSDNGATALGSNGSLRGTKGTVWEGGHRVPAIAWWPGRITPGVTGQTAIGMDLMPTLLNIAGAEATADRPLDGVDLSPLLFSGRSLDPRRLFWEYNEWRAVRDHDWKLVENGSGQADKPGLYNLADDVSESRNLAGDHPGRVERMAAALAAWRQDVAGGATVQPTE
jgi:arylsulfatase A-like enzyme